VNRDPQFEKFSHVLSRLKNLVWGQNGTGKATCPAHDDRHPSLSVRMGRNGDLLLKCHAKNANCTLKDIAAALGCEVRDFWKSLEGKPKERKTEIESRFEYLSEHGEVLFRSIRTTDKDFWLERWDTEANRWFRGLNGVVQLVPFHLPELLASKEPWVCVAEGEKKVLALESLGFTATCNAAGAEKWEPSWGEWFRGKRVAIFPDYDEAGYKHAGLVASSLFPYANLIVIVELFGLRLKQDIADWLLRWPDDRLVRRRAVMRAIEASPFFDNTDAQYRLAQLRLHMARSLVASCLI
jgi:hypothetical protein